MKINQRSKHPSLVVFRSMVPSDGSQLAALFQANPDNGRFAISPYYQIDPYKALLTQYPNTVGVVAESHERLVGVGLVRFGHCCVGGRNCPYAWLNSLLVHPASRQNGIGTELAHRRIALARDKVGEDGIIFASVQSNNEVSLNITKKWSDFQVRQLQSILVKTRTKPPGPMANVTIRKAHTEDLTAIANGLNTFYAGFNLYEPQHDETLSALITQKVCDKPIHKCFVAVNKKQEIVAGLILSEQHRLVAMKVDRLPKAVALLNKAIRFIPSDAKPILSNRQKEIVSAIAQNPDASYQQIANKLSITESTVKGHLNKVFKALEVANITACILAYMQQRLIPFTIDELGCINFGLLEEAA